VISYNSQIVSVQGNLRINFCILLQTLFVIQMLIRKKSARINFETLYFKYNYYLHRTNDAMDVSQINQWPNKKLMNNHSHFTCIRFYL
jgi:hypothetical protein